MVPRKADRFLSTECQSRFDLSCPLISHGRHSAWASYCPLVTGWVAFRCASPGEVCPSKVKAVCLTQSYIISWVISPPAMMLLTLEMLRMGRTGRERPGKRTGEERGSPACSALRPPSWTVSSGPGNLSTKQRAAWSRKSPKFLPLGAQTARMRTDSVLMPRFPWMIRLCPQLYLDTRK